MQFTESNNTVAVYTKTNTGTNVIPVVAYTLEDTLDCILNQLSESKAIRKEGGKVLANYVIFVDYTTIIKQNSIMVVGSEEFSVYRIYNPNEMNDHLEIFCLRNERGVEVDDS